MSAEVIWVNSHWVEAYADGIPSDFDAADVALSGYLGDRMAWDDDRWPAGMTWMPLCELDAAPIDLIAVAVDGLYGAFGESPTDLQEAVESIVAYFATTKGVMKESPLGATTKVAAKDRRGSGDTTQCFIVQLASPISTKNAERTIDTLRTMLFDGSPRRKTDKAGEGTKGTRAVQGLEATFAVAIACGSRS